MSIVLLSQYMKELGVSDDLSLHDIPSLEEELFCLVPEPVNAIMMVAPLNEKVSESTAVYLGSVHQSCAINKIHQKHECFME